MTIFQQMVYGHRSSHTMHESDYSGEKALQRIRGFGSEPVRRIFGIT